MSHQTRMLTGLEMISIGKSFHEFQKRAQRRKILKQAIKKMKVEGKRAVASKKNIRISYYNLSYLKMWLMVWWRAVSPCHYKCMNRHREM